MASEESAVSVSGKEIRNLKSHQIRPDGSDHEVYTQGVTLDADDVAELVEGQHQILEALNDIRSMLLMIVGGG